MLDYPFRRLFDAGCCVADMEPNIVLESQAPHTLLALAEAEQGIAIIPSVLHPGAEVSAVAVQGAVDGTSRRTATVSFRCRTSPEQRPFVQPAG